jgi:hypothetical protein
MFQACELDVSQAFMGVVPGVVIAHRDRYFVTYGHSQLKTGHPVRSAIHKQLNGRLVLRWVTTWESLLLYVLSLLISSMNLLLFNLLC